MHVWADIAWLQVLIKGVSTGGSSQTAGNEATNARANCHAFQLDKIKKCSANLTAKRWIDRLLLYMYTIIIIAGNIDGELNLADWRFGKKTPKLNLIPPILLLSTIVTDNREPPILNPPITISVHFQANRQI